MLRNNLNADEATYVVRISAICFPCLSLDHTSHLTLSKLNALAFPFQRQKRAVLAHVKDECQKDAKDLLFLLKGLDNNVLTLKKVEV